MDNEEIKRLIETGVPTSVATVDGDGTHFQAIVISAVFQGLGLVKRHQLVYAALGNRMGGEIHALSIQTYTPKEWEESKSLPVL
ncbi:MAG: BolA family protein [Gammaproteobacteria bacterium]